MFYYAGTGNVSASDINFDDNYITIFNPKGSFYVTVTADCQPEDGEFRTVDLENATFSNPNNANIDRYNLLGIIFHLNMYRRIAVNITNIEFHDFEKTATHMIMAYGAFSDTFYASNIRYTNVEGNYQFNHIQLWQQVTLQNIEFNGITSNFDVSAILAEYNLYFKIHNISFINSNGTASFTSGLIELNNLPQTFTEITELSVEDSYLRHRKAVRNLQTLNSLTLTN